MEIGTVTIIVELQLWEKTNTFPMFYDHIEPPNVTTIII